MLLKITLAWHLIEPRHFPDAVQFELKLHHRTYFVGLSGHVTATVIECVTAGNWAADRPDPGKLDQHSAGAAGSHR